MTWDSDLNLLFSITVQEYYSSLVRYDILFFSIHVYVLKYCTFILQPTSLYNLISKEELEQKCCFDTEKKIESYVTTNVKAVLNFIAFLVTNMQILGVFV